MKRIAYFISDGTGITAETLGNALLAQFDKIEFSRDTLPYIDSIEKANSAVEKINLAAVESGMPAIVFDTIIDKNIRAIIDTANAFKVDIFEAFLNPLEQELNTESSYSVGKSHSATNSASYWLTQVQTQQVAASRLRALETGRWVLQVAPTGFSAVIDPLGRVLQRTGVGEQAVLHHRVERRQGLTWASRMGTWPMALLSLLAMAVAWTASRRRT